MTVYVDSAKNPYHRMIMCHLLADSVDELHLFAYRLNLKREWFQSKSTPHYDLSQTKRKLAVSLGAVEISNKEVAAIIRKYRNETNS